MKLVLASISFFTITLFATAGMAQNQLSVQDQLQAIMDRFPGGGMKVQPAVIRYEDSEMSRQASEAGEPCLECMGVKRIEVKQIGAEDTRAFPTGSDIQASNGVGAIVCRSPRVKNNNVIVATGNLVARGDVVITAAHEFAPEKNILDARGEVVRRVVEGKYNFQTDCTFNLYLQDSTGRKQLIFKSNFISKETGNYQMPNLDIGEDWAVLRLATKPPANLGIQPLRWKSLSAQEIVDQPVSHFSFSDVSGQLYKVKSSGFMRAAKASNGSELTVLHSCDTNGASSGGAMVMKNPRDGRYYAVGVHTGGMKADLNSAVRLDGKFATALQRAIAESDQRNSI